MPSVYDLKTRFQDLLRPIVRSLARAGITANKVTVFAFLLSLATGVWLALLPESRAPYFAYPAILLVRMALNAIDGMLAREFGQKSQLGAFLNEIGDVLSDAALYLALGMIAGASFFMATLFVILAMTTELTGLIAASIGASRRYDGPMGKSDRAFAIGAFMFFAGLFPALLAWTNLLLTILSLLCLWTVSNRIRKAIEAVT
jgi:CDP-diacylglycerol--glycerol-3-phosphate 3-phosphatidyltransferase